MITENRLNLVAPCGLDCGVCELYLCKDKTELFKYLVSIGIPKNKIPCKGCLAVEGNCPVSEKTCETYACVVAKKLSFCSECSSFPCIKLQPCANRAETLPHNMKTYNLCKIAKEGLEAFVKKSEIIKTRYYKGKMVLGEGPQL